VLAIVLALASAIGYGGSTSLGGLAMAGVCVSLIAIGGAS
jgi:hypothetical protein